MGDDLIDEATVTQHTWSMRHQTDEHVQFIEQLYKMCKIQKDKAASMGGEINQMRDQLDKEKEARYQAEAQTTVKEQQLKDKQNEMERQAAELNQRNEETRNNYEQKLSNQKTEHENRVNDLESKIGNTIRDSEQRYAETVRACDDKILHAKLECEKKVQDINDTVQVLSNEVSQLKESNAEKDRQLQQGFQDRDDEIRELKRQVMASESTVKGVMFMRQNVDAFHLITGAIIEPVAACMLPDGCILVADTMAGLLLYSPHTQLIQKLVSEQWKWPQGIVYNQVDRNIVVSCMQKQRDGSFRRVIKTFHVEPDELKLYHQLREGEDMYGPPEADVDTHVAKEKLARAPNGDLYLSLADNLGSALYKYSKSEWNLLTKRQGATFTDLAVLAQTGPVTEVLVVESRMGYIHKLSIRGKDVASRSSIACVEKPSCIAVDQLGQLFVQDVISGKVHGVNSRFEVVRDVCLIDDAVFSMTASHGFLGVALREQKTVRIYRYESSEVAEIPEYMALST